MKYNSRKNFTSIVFGLVFLIASSTGLSQSKNSQRKVDPSDFVTRFELKNQYIDKQGGGYKNLFVPRFEYAVSQYHALRVEIPLVTQQPFAAGRDVDFGIGDLSLKSSWRVHKGKGIKVVSGLGITLDTAAEYVLGSGKDVLKPFIFASIRMSQLGAIFIPYLQHNVSVSGKEDSSDVSNTFFKPMVFKILSGRKYIFLEPTVYVNHEISDKVGVTFQGEIGKLMGKPTMVYIKPGFGLHGTDVPQVSNWSFTIGMRHFFR